MHTFNPTCLLVSTNDLILKVFSGVFLSRVIVALASMECHDDPSFEAEAGLLQYLQFTWLGSLQYIHVKNGHPHYFRAPRVVLISREFVLSTAFDAAQVPAGYALGNVVFGDYERDEDECSLSPDEVSRGAACAPVLMLMPVADVLLHPEYKNFGVTHSIALLRLVTAVKSSKYFEYMLPACLPLKDFIRMRMDDRLKPDRYYHLDFTSEVPRDYGEESKEIIITQMLPMELCSFDDDRQGKKTDVINVREACSEGCGLRSGAPTIIQEHTGHWTVISLSQGGSPCPDPLRPQRSSAPPAHTLLHPYSSWITTAITGRSADKMLRSDPFGYLIPAQTMEKQKQGWVGKWWMGGIRCFDRGGAADQLFRFYHEVFEVEPAYKINATYYIEINGNRFINVACVKLGVPYQMADPTIWGLYTSNVKVRVKLHPFFMEYAFEIEAWGYNITDTKYWQPTTPPTTTQTP